MAESSHLVLRLVMLFLWVVMLVVTVLAYTGTLGKHALATAAKINDTALTPASYTFYSLAIIGLLQGMGCIYAVAPIGYQGNRRDVWKAKTINSVGPWWVIGFVCEILWAGLWTQTLGFYVIVSFCLQMAGLLAFAIGYGVLMRATADHAREANRAVSTPSYLLFYIPTAMNLAWLTIGTCIGLLTIVSNYAPKVATQNGMQILAVIFVVLVTFVGMLIEAFHASIFYGLTLIWTFTGIYISKKSDTNYSIMDQAMLVCLILLSLSTLISILISVFRCFRKADDKQEPLTGNDFEEQKDDGVVQV